MIRTRVGYSGGTKENPTYRSLGDHTESIEIDYNPEVISYNELLEIFWCSHHPTRPPYSKQYMSIIFYHNDQQKRLAIQTKEKREMELNSKIHTEIRPYEEFYRAEDYHQKYALKQNTNLTNWIKAIYPDAKALTDSTAAARLNGFVYGYGSKGSLEAAENELGLTSEASATLQAHAKGRIKSPLCN